MTVYTIAAIILLIILLVVSYILIVYGESEENCVEFSSPHLLIIDQRSNFGGTIDGCDWLVDKVMWNGTGMHIAFYSHHEAVHGDNSMIGWQRFVMTK